MLAMLIYWSGSSNYKNTAGLFFFYQKNVFPGAGDVSLSLSDVQFPVKQ